MERAYNCSFAFDDPYSHDRAVKEAARVVVVRAVAKAAADSVADSAVAKARAVGTVGVGKVVVKAEETVGEATAQRRHSHVSHSRSNRTQKDTCH